VAHTFPSLLKRILILLSIIAAYFGAESMAGWRVARASVATAAAYTAASAVTFDFDGDGKADVSRSRIVTDTGGSEHQFRVRKSSNATFDEYVLAVGSGRIAPGDFNGDGKTDAAVFNAGTWTYKTSSGGSAQTISFGT
jgi:hypothetical protein